ncbi:aminotransferase class V-fold PLP-dependent enzyme [Salinibacterium sp. SWN1162]|uniref:aminotransferase class V-fold PLP-dependent enzyme n=1 Tax=Salinibacterium sp. SWN1162 TaxID=2792053 RepID=UPI0018CF68BC|nr:aminotransferase class V-fold PLP-dependent enzyme [Salinibacterium sp. SWN1162]MBH0009159.1 aminotransferase class V-fold PLP-dependent enzyme [Salinibacterium sp. SWN1162]
MTSPALAHAIGSFANTHGYLSAATMGLPTCAAVTEMTTKLQLWATATCNPMNYGDIVERTRGHYARLVGVDTSRVAIGSQTSVMASLIACSLPAGSEVLVVESDFTSIVFPFLQHRDLIVRAVPLAELADAITDSTALVAFSLIQSCNGKVADVDAVLAAAAAHGARTLCDVTQAAGVYPVDASQFDATVCHAYKWLCSPRGVAFLTISEHFAEHITPVQAGWYAGEDVWGSAYGTEMNLAKDARQFDVSPAWQAWVGAEHPIAMFADLDISEVWAHCTGLANQLCDELGIERQNQAIVTWPDESGADLAKLAAAGITASGRAGRLRAAFHLWNTEEGVAAVIAALRG